MKQQTGRFVCNQEILNTKLNKISCSGDFNPGTAMVCHERNWKKLSASLTSAFNKNLGSAAACKIICVGIKSE